MAYHVEAPSLLPSSSRRSLLKLRSKRPVAASDQTATSDDATCPSPARGSGSGGWPRCGMSDISVSTTASTPTPAGPGVGGALRLRVRLPTHLPRLGQVGNPSLFIMCFIHVGMNGRTPLLKMPSHGAARFSISYWWMTSLSSISGCILCRRDGEEALPCLQPLSLLMEGCRLSQLLAVVKLASFCTACCSEQDFSFQSLGATRVELARLEAQATSTWAARASLHKMCCI